ncbi:serine/threonine-protein kinase Nek11, partial [Tachysurus ichikawai]
SLGCILYEMCCLKHAFEGQNFLSVVQKIMESSTPSLPEKYSPELNSLMQNRSITSHPSVLELDGSFSCWMIIRVGDR